LLFWTVIFFTLSLILLIRGNIFYNSPIKIGELTIKKFECSNDNRVINKEFETASLKLMFPMLFYAFLVICEFIYFIYAINIDIYKYPSIFIMLFFVLNIVLRYKPAKKIEDIGVDEFRKILYKTKKYTFRGFIYQIIYMSYFSYIFWILVFLK